MQYVVESAALVNKTQILILVIEGVILTVTVVMYVWHLSFQVRKRKDTGLVALFC